MNTIHAVSFARSNPHPMLIDDLVARILDAIYKRSYQTATNLAQFDREIPATINPCNWLNTIGIMVIETERRQQMLAAILARGEWRWE